MADGQFLSYAVIDSIIDQTVVCEIIPACSPGVIQSNHTVLNPLDKIKKIQCETESRNKALDILKLYPQVAYFAMQDRDIVHLNALNFSHAIGRLKLDEKLAVVSLPLFIYDNNVPETSFMYGHIRTAAMVCRTDYFINSGFRFRYDTEYHLCKCMKEDIEKSGYRIEYLGNVPLVKELK